MFAKIARASSSFSYWKKEMKTKTMRNNALAAFLELPVLSIQNVLPEIIPFHYDRLAHFVQP